MTENAQLEFARMENAHPGKCQNGNCTTWKMTEKSHPRKWQEKLNLENTRMEMHPLENTRIENAQPGKCQNGNCMPWKMTKKSQPGKWQKIDNLNFPKWKIHTPENARTQIARPGKWQKINPLVLKWWNTISSNFHCFRPKNVTFSLLLNFSKMSVLGPPWVNLDL